MLNPLLNSWLTGPGGKYSLSVKPICYNSFTESAESSGTRAAPPSDLPP